MLEVALAIPFWLEMLATVAGAIFGALSAVRARYDIFGVCCIAIVVGVSGGMLRDVLLQNYGIYAFQQPSLIIVCIVAGIAVFYFGQLFESIDTLIDPLDNLSVALWAVIGTGKGLSAGLDIVPAILLGTITANGGGIMRDIAMNREVQAFQAGTFYVTAALIGCIAYAVMHTYHILDNYAGLTCVVIVLGVRYASRYFGWTTKPAHDYSHVVKKPIHDVAEKMHLTSHDEEKKRKEQEQRSAVRLFIRRLNGQAANELPPADDGDHFGTHISTQDPDDGNDVY